MLQVSLSTPEKGKCIVRLGTQTIQVQMEEVEVVAPICLLGEPGVVVNGGVLGDGLK